MKTALIIVDPQNDFCEGGSLAVTRSNEIFPHINKLRNSIDFDMTVITLDWHPKNHFSFADNYRKKPFQQIQFNGAKQMLWPTHCVQNSIGAQCSLLLDIKATDYKVLKGFRQYQEAYSGFGTYQNPTELKNLLIEKQIEKVYVVGLAFDYCVGLTAIDSKKIGFETYIIQQCTKSVSSITQAEMKINLQKAGVGYKSINQLFSNIN